jgi:UDP-N-acetylmuramyl pentapeptide phosphotransferase/UDP-N-acetylglucosamine-1-phosphate transferase
MASFGASLLFIPLATVALSAGLTALSIRYAHRKRLLDLPGQRRSHSVPTPRGGGIAIVAAMLAGSTAMLYLMQALGLLVPLMPPIIGIALVGWMDDHGGLSATKRFAMHWIAVFWVFAIPLLLSLGISDAPRVDALAIVVMLMTAVATVWSINLHNFMDGIDGLLTLQAIFVFAALALLSLWHNADATGLLLVCAAACLGFLPFNFPRARIFMGDVGSGALGFAIAIAVLWQMSTPRLAITTGIVLCSAFVTDATCTLLSRMWRGRRWYSAHREHLYQWLARSGFSHAQVVAFYMGWNLLIVAPVVYWMNRVPAAFVSDESGLDLDGFVFAALVYALAVALWRYGKRWCLHRICRRRRHAA